MKIWLKYLALLSLTACVSTELDYPKGTPDNVEPISMRCKINQVDTRRVEDGGFSNGDAVGIYIVNYENGNPGVLKTDGNHVTNAKFTFDEVTRKWNPEKPVYWKDKSTSVDAYGYYPYKEEISKVNAMPFIVYSNQSEVDKESGLVGYEASDLLWAKASDVSPASGIIDLQHNHMMANVLVSLVPGEGFTTEEWAALEKIVMVENTYLGSYVDLSTGEVTVDKTTETQSIVTIKDGQDWRAIVVPQIVDQGKTLISITVNGYAYHFVRDDIMTFHPGKMHKFTIQVQNSIPTGDYQFTLLDEAVTSWESDLVSHNGEVKEYIVVHIPEPGQLSEVIKKMDIDPSNIMNLKLSGYMTEIDFDYIKKNITDIEALNLKDVRLINCDVGYIKEYVNEVDYDYVFPVEDDILPEYCCHGLKNLRTIVFPDKLRMIGVAAFLDTQLEGDLVIPEGVTHICDNAFANGDVKNNLTGKLVLPSSLSYIGTAAFMGCDFHCNLIFPDDLEHIGDNAFLRCKNITGRLILPKKLSRLCQGSFSEMTKISGTVDIPEGLTIIPKTFSRSTITGVTIPNTIKIIEEYAFLETSLKGELNIPASVTEIRRSAFNGTAIESLQLSDNIEYLGESVFAYCSQLRGVVKLPNKLNSVPPYCFFYSSLEGVILPDNLESIEKSAFGYCFSLAYLRSDSLIPPVVKGESAFYGVPKDNFTIEVPKESVSSYRSAEVWNEFKRISAYRGFVCRPSTVNVLNSGGTRKIILNADADWTMISCPEWCHLSKVAGNKKTELTLYVEPMSHNQGNKSGVIEFKLNDSNEHYTFMTVDQYDYEYEEDQYLSLQKSSKGNGIDIFIVGDGYDAADISSGLYLNDMRQEMEYFFAVEPYKTYRDYFDVHTAIALSHESGIGTLNTLRDVKFGTVYETRINGNPDAIVEYAIETVDGITSEDIHQLTAIVIPNSDSYDGVTNMWTNGTAVAFCPKSSSDFPNDARGLIQHEAGGHAFGKLGDEYIYHNSFIQTCSCICCEHTHELLSAKSCGWYRNLSLKGKYGEVDWAHLIFDSRYGDIVDVYEGGYFHKRGVYRSEANSCMNNNVPYFSTISRQAIVERIMEYAGEEFSFEDFVANDSREWGNDFADLAHTRSVQEEDCSMHAYHYHPIIIEGSPLD